MLKTSSHATPNEKEPKTKWKEEQEKTEKAKKKHKNKTKRNALKRQDNNKNTKNSTNHLANERWEFRIRPTTWLVNCRERRFKWNTNSHSLGTTLFATQWVLGSQSDKQWESEAERKQILRSKYIISNNLKWGLNVLLVVALLFLFLIVCVCVCAFLQFSFVLHTFSFFNSLCVLKQRTAKSVVLFLCYCNWHEKTNYLQLCLLAVPLQLMTVMHL